MSESEKPKDTWDKFSALGPFLSGLLVAGIGFYFTWSYNRQQLRLNEIQTVERFIPRLLGMQEEKELAIIAISAIGNNELATKLATRYPSQGTAAALQTLTRTAESGEQKRAQEALTAVQTELDKRSKERATLIKQIFDNDKATRIAATTKLIREWRTDEKVIPETLDMALSNTTNASGIINTLVLFENFEPALLKRYSQEINQLLEAAKANGPQTESHLKQLKSLVGTAETH